MHYRKDIYGRDATLARALAGLPPLPPAPSDQKSGPNESEGRASASARSSLGKVGA